MSRKTRENRNDRETTPPTGLPRGLSWRVRLARTAVAWERLWPRIWGAAALAALFAGLALLGVPPLLGGWLHLALLAGFLLAFAALVLRGARGLQWPGPADGQRRLERDSGLQHRPLTGLDDTLAAGARDPGSAALWQAHLTRLRRLLGHLRVAPPRASLAAVDPIALRVVPVLVLAAGLIVAGSDAPQRLLQAATPNLSGAPSQPPSLDVWLDPPAYTGKAPKFVATGEQSEPVLRAPVGSRLLVQVQGGGEVPQLRMGDRESAFEQAAKNAWKLETELDINAGPSIAVSQDGTRLASWDLHIVPDGAPEIAFRMPPQQGRRNALRVDYTAKDDYGVEAVRLRIERPGDERVPAIVRSLPLSGDESPVENASYHDFTAHVWAGLEVEMTLEAEDALGQTGHSDSVRTVLPERTFQHPVARELVELRKQLTLEPGNRYPVVQGLAKLQRHPEHFFDDSVVALAIRSAERRLLYDKTTPAVAQVQELMWRTALRIEEGEIAIAERDLRRAEQALMDALSRDDASDAELQRLMNDLEAALNRFLEALSEHMRQQLAEGKEPEPLPPDAQILETQDLREMMRRMRDMAQTGARDAAREMLARMQSILENLSRQPMLGRMDEQQRRAMQMMQQMRSLSERQQELLDNSFNRAQRQQQQGRGQSQRMQPGQEGSQTRQGRQGMLSDAERQEALRRSLGRMMRELGDMLGDIPQPLGQAERRMRDATRALEQGQPGEAAQPQSDALDGLHQGMQAMREAMQQQMQAQQPGQGEGHGEYGWSPGQRRDPLGRARDEDGEGRIDTGDVSIPDEMELRRTREILRELRERAGERNRPETELDYIDRLLRRF